MHEKAELKVGVHGKDWIDFKSIKNTTLDVLFRDVEEGNMLNFNLADTETIIDKIGSEVAIRLKRDVTIELKETNKYSISTVINYAELLEH